MKVIICDVGDAACAFVSSANGKTMMIDCGCSPGPDKTNPVDIFYKCKDWFGSRYFTDYYKGQTYPITLLHITHPDDDHVRNARRVVNDLTPCLVLKNDYELFPWRFRSKGPQKTDDYFGVKPPKKDSIINKKGMELGSRASNFRSIATQFS